MCVKHETRTAEKAGPMRITRRRNLFATYQKRVKDCSVSVVCDETHMYGQDPRTQSMGKYATTIRILANIDGILSEPEEAASRWRVSTMTPLCVKSCAKEDPEDGGVLVRLVIVGKPIPEPDPVRGGRPGSSVVLPNNACKLVRELATWGEREPGDFRWTAFGWDDLFGGAGIGREGQFAMIAAEEGSRTGDSSLGVQVTGTKVCDGGFSRRDLEDGVQNEGHAYLKGG